MFFKKLCTICNTEYTGEVCPVCNGKPVAKELKEKTIQNTSKSVTKKKKKKHHAMQENDVEFQKKVQELIDKYNNK